MKKFFLTFGISSLLLFASSAQIVQDIQKTNDNDNNVIENQISKIDQELLSAKNLILDKIEQKINFLTKIKSCIEEIENSEDLSNCKNDFRDIQSNKEN